MQYLMDDLVIGETRDRELRSRKLRYYEATVSRKKLPLYESDNWYIYTQNKNSYRVRLDKSIHECIEDEVWTLLARLGFYELNKNREFKIQCGDSGRPRKIDVFAKDGQTALIVEATASEKPTKKSLISLIDKIKSYREDVAHAISQHYGTDARLKIGWIIATRNILWNSSDEDRARESGITILRDDELDYYATLQKHLKRAARYQLLAHIFDGKSIQGLKMSVAATQGRAGGKRFYNFLLSPANLLKIAYVGHKNSRGQDAIETYQRMLKQKRLKDIAEYIDDGGQFPTNIVINFQTNQPIRFDKKQEVGSCAFGELHLPNRYASAWIIDGQHRLYGYALSGRAESSVVPILAYENLPSTEQKNLFVDINHKQVKVPRGLLLDLYAELHWDSSDASEKLESLAARIVKNLGRTTGSPLKDRVLVAEERRTPTRNITLTTLALALRESQLLGGVTPGQNMYIPGPLCDNDINKSLKRSSNFLQLYFTRIRSALPDQWGLGSAKGGYVCTNNALVAFIRVLRSICDHLATDGPCPQVATVEELDEYVAVYLVPALEWLRSLSAEQVATLRTLQGSKGQREVSMNLMEAIHNSRPEFEPRNLREWIESFDEQGTRRARNMVPEIQRCLFNCVIEVLKRNFGSEDDRWWSEGIPKKIRVKCVTRLEEDEEGARDKEQYLDLIDYKEIASSKWSGVFQPFFSIGSKQQRKDEQLRWITKLGGIRNTVSHPERGRITREEFEFVQTIYDQVRINMKEFWPS